MGYVGAKPSAVPLTSADITDGIITSAKIADGTIVNADINASAAIVNSKLSGVGITQADMFRINADTSLSTSATTLTSNIERVDTNSFSVLGTGMTQSSGIFTFPSTGYYLINGFLNGYNGSSTSQYAVLYLQVTTDNSNYSTASAGYSHVGQSSYYYGLFTSHILDVTNTTNIKVRFRAQAQHASTIIFGDTNENSNGFQFIRLGDT